jgi:PAS domain S-box-containing protein
MDFRSTLPLDGTESACTPAESSELHYALFELAPDGIIVSDHEGCIVQLNAEAERQFGYRRHELIGEPIEKLIPERFRAHLANRARYQADAMNRTRQLFGRRKDGSEFPVDISLSLVQTERGILFYSIIPIDGLQITNSLKGKGACP